MDTVGNFDESFFIDYVGIQSTGGLGKTAGAHIQWQRPLTVYCVEKLRFWQE